MKTRYIILATIIFFIFSAVFLSYTENKQQDFGYNKNWWSTYFVNPKSKDISFVIENYSNQNNFHWEIFIDKEKILQGDEIIKKSESKSVTLTTPNISEKQLLVEVTTPKESKEIYKNL